LSRGFFIARLEPGKAGDPLSNADYYGELSSRLDFMDEPSWGKADPIEKGLIVVAEVSAAALSLYQGIRDPSQHAALQAAIDRVYAEKIKPLDIPGIGPLFESVLDNNAPAIIGGLVPLLAAFLDRRLPRQTIGA
jgi:hypothetical protein